MCSNSFFYKVRKNELGVDEFVDGLIDVEAEKELAKVAAALETVADDDLEDEDDQDDTGKASGMSEEDLKIFTKEVLKRFSSIKRSHNKLEALRKQKKWMDDPEYKKHQDSIVKVLINFRFSSKFVEVLCDKIRIFIKNIRHHEKEIMEFCVFESKMPRGHFIKSFAENSTNLKWLNS